MSRLRWRCRRGMRELDLLVGGWLERSYATASDVEQAAFQQLLESPDPLLYAWLTGRERPADPVLARLVDAISTH
ncbi:MAG: succinate dehydrogenase assembly factor 2 [Gammaproteobacteria bacterium]|nr:succinate dehydrogenase assembly factor 2 [Gammaproteobacteria bacterium]